MAESKELAIAANAPNVIEDSEHDVFIKKIDKLNRAIKLKSTKDYLNICVDRDVRKFAIKWLDIRSGTIALLDSTSRAQLDQLIYEIAIEKAKQLKFRRKIFRSIFWPIMCTTPILATLFNEFLLLALFLPIIGSGVMTTGLYSHGIFLSDSLLPFIKHYEQLKKIEEDNQEK